ncbi:hypothetical protein V502_05957 [Pseudogymnoascus sp. VKM F-4520 (FW-2644)]|nr:hypothetical protein V502_05957 [Pseudogymnoascus sp. VKM F-4520 (FW-2644)]
MPFSYQPNLTPFQAPNHPTNIPNAPIPPPSQPSPYNSLPARASPIFSDRRYFTWNIPQFLLLQKKAHHLRVPHQSALPPPNSTNAELTFPIACKQQYAICSNCSVTIVLARLSMGSRVILGSLGLSHLALSPSLIQYTNRREDLYRGVCLNAYLHRPDKDPHYTQGLRQERADAEASGDEVISFLKGGGGAAEGAEGCVGDAKPAA